MKLNLLFVSAMGAMCVMAEPIYKHTLRHVPEKLRHERTLQEVQQRVLQVTQQILKDAEYTTETNFTLFCLEPNHEQERYEQQGRSLFQNNGLKYLLNENENLPLVKIHPKPYCSIQDGYELYRRTYRDVTKEYEPPIISIQWFFQSFNQQFPDINLSISHKRISTGIFETDCCPIYTVSW